MRLRLLRLFRACWMAWYRTDCLPSGITRYRDLLMSWREAISKPQLSKAASVNRFSSLKLSLGSICSRDIIVLILKLLLLFLQIFTNRTYFPLFLLISLFLNISKKVLLVTTPHKQFMMLQSPSPRKQRNVSQEPSKVLLVCVYDTVALEMTNQAIYDRFRVFGNIVRLLIFDRGEVTKLFVEFGEVEQAVQAQRQLDGSKLYGSICKMNIYFSNFSNVDLKNQTSQGADYSDCRLEQAHFVHRYDQLTRSSPEEDPEEFNDLIMQSFDASPLARSKTDSPALMAALQASHQNYRSQDNDIQHSNRTTEIEQSIRTNINSILDSNSSSSMPSYPSTPSKVFSANPQQLRLKQALRTGSVALSFRYDRDMEINHVYNIFSNFGNISGIVKKKRHFYVRFRSLEFASIVRTYLSGTRLMGNGIVLEPASDAEACPRENQWSQCIFYDSSFDRFTPQKSITINAPSFTLHVSSLKRQACEETVLKQIFEEYGQVEKVVLLRQSQEKNMALIKFFSIEDSFRAVACLHNAFLHGRKMAISFTKSRT